jgi:hypothetical protein
MPQTRETSGRWYKRRLPLLGQVPRENSHRPPLSGTLLPIVCEVVPRYRRGIVRLEKVRTQNVTRPPLNGALVPVLIEVRVRAFRGLVRLSAVPPPPVKISGFPHPNLVLAPGWSRMARGLQYLGPMHRTNPTPPAVRPFDYLRTPLAQGQRHPAWSRLPATKIIVVPPPNPPPPVPPDRVYRRRASVATTFTLRADVATLLVIRASVKTTFTVRASDPMSVPSNFAFFQGEDVLLKFQLTPPQDMTGWGLTCSVKNQLGGPLQFNPAVTITDAGRGQFQASLPRAQTSTLAPGDYVWDVRRTDSGSNTVLAHGELTCKQPVTP